MKTSFLPAFLAIALLAGGCDRAAPAGSAGQDKHENEHEGEHDHENDGDHDHEGGQDEHATAAGAAVDDEHDHDARDDTSRAASSHGHDETDAHVDEHGHTGEARTTIPAAIAAASGIETATAGAGVIREHLSLYGVIRPDASRVREVRARFPGVVRSVAAQPGDRVGAGSTLATVESNESLQVYAVTAPISGTVTARNANTGEITGDQPLFEVADFSSVWAELNVFPRDRARLALGQRVAIRAADADLETSGTISFIAPGGVVNQPLVTRVVLDNASGAWVPGQFVNADVLIAEAPVSVAIPAEATQPSESGVVVYEVTGDRYEAKPVKLGRTDGRQVEVLEGLLPGTRYVSRNSYLVKADIAKASAAHEH